MKSFLGSLVLTLAIGLAGLSVAVVNGQTTPPTEIVLEPGVTYRVTCATRFDEISYQIQPGVWVVTCRARPATATPAPTLTPVPPTATLPPATPFPTPIIVTDGWHVPTDHEHGDRPPDWVLNSAWPPFTQSRESHNGYKGVYDDSPGGVESYFIAHIISSEAARSHGDHDYELWLRDPETGDISHYEGVMDFGSPPPERTSDTGERPIILSVGDAGCETWYSDPGSTVMDVGWTICGRYQSFDGTVLGGTGTFRTMDWIIPCNRLPSTSPLQNNCQTEFGVSRLSFLVNSRDYFVPGIVPIN